jgi:hypothetical protein
MTILQPTSRRALVSRWGWGAWTAVLVVVTLGLAVYQWRRWSACTDECTGRSAMTERTCRWMCR